MRAALVLVIATGCNAVFGLDPVGRGDAGGGGDGPGGDGPAGDRDGDGVADGADDCPDQPDPRQHDEDGDGVGDVCDGCPHVADASQADGDGDHVGDACDPRPAQAGEWLARFDAFDDGVLTNEWTESGTGTGWFEDNDALFAPDAAGLYILASAGPDSATWFRLETAVIVKGVDATTVHSIAVSGSYRSETDAFICNWRTDTAMGSSAALLQQLGAGGVMTLGLGTATPVDDGAEATLAVDTTVSGGSRCRVASGVPADLMAATTPGSATVALRVNRAQAAFSYLVVIAR